MSTQSATFVLTGWDRMGDLQAAHATVLVARQLAQAPASFVPAPVSALGLAQCQTLQSDVSCLTTCRSLCFLVVSTAHVWAASLLMQQARTILLCSWSSGALPPPLLLLEQGLRIHLAGALNAGLRHAMRLVSATV